MPKGKKRRVFEQGHLRKFLVIVDETPEVEAALLYAAHRMRRTGGRLSLLYVIEPQGFHHWMGVKQVRIEEETNKAKALFRLFRRKLGNAGFDNLDVEELIREGKKAPEIVKLIEEDEDIAVLVLGASTDSKGPGPLVASLGAGKLAGTFPIPITIVPGTLTAEEIQTMA